MPRLSDLTDYDPMGNYTGGILPVEPIIGVNNNADLNLPVKFSDDPKLVNSTPASNNVDKILNSLFRDDEKRYQLWPEKLVRSGTTAAGRAMTGEIPQWAVDPATGDVHTSPQMVEAAQEMSALAGTGGLGGTGGTLNATPSLRPALKHNGKLYKGKPGQEHMDVIPESMYPDFQKKAMNGEDIKEYNFGFINDKGHFLNREDALKYGIDNGLIDPQAGKFGALTSTLFADSSKPGAAIEAMKTANPFFSALEHNVKQISQSKMTGDQWLGTLGNKPGVKPEELQWTGLQDFLNENKGKPVTKAQIEEHLQNNKVELKEVTKGTGELQKAAKDFNAEAGPKPINVPGRGQLYADEIEQGLWDGSLTPKDLPTNLQPHAEKMLSLRHQQEQPTKYSSYQLPGGENYREMLLTLPPGKEVFDQNLMYYMRKYPQVTKEIKTLEDVALAEKHNPAFRETMKGLSPEEVLATARASEKPANETYRSSHWDEPNILAHVRMNDRTIEGKKSLHLEEIQSDWHQQGREKGYADNKKPYEVFDPTTAEIKGRYATEAEAKAAATKGLDYSKSEGFPDAPFKKSWHELALKRMLREASEKGYDRLSWTPGEAQAARYDLSKSIDTLKYSKGDKNTQSGMLVAKDKNGGIVFSQVAKHDELPNIVGKEAAKKLLDQEFEQVHTSGTGYHELKGADLKIGSEGMKGFYDQIIPKAIEKLGKEHGVRVKKGGVGDGYQALDKNGEVMAGFKDKISAEKWIKQMGNKYELKEATNPVHYIDIPQSLKDTATQKGFPLFSAGGYMLMPVAHNPFEDKK